MGGFHRAPLSKVPKRAWAGVFIFAQKEGVSAFRPVAPGRSGRKYLLPCSVAASDSATSWTVTHLAPLPMGFPRQEYWSGLPFPSPGDLADPGIEPSSPALAGRCFSTELPMERRRPWHPYTLGFGFCLPSVLVTSPAEPIQSLLFLSASGKEVPGAGLGGAGKKGMHCLQGISAN